jgi:UDP-N-acetylmuramate dehydrogenase
MHIKDDVSLIAYSTMRLGGIAAHLVEASSRKDVADAVAWADEKNLPCIMIGIGSNIIWADKGFPGLVIISKIKRFETFEEEEGEVYITVGGGENWDSVVERCTDHNLSGIEALSLIPGTAGATPIQNVGAYGQEIADTLVSVEAYDRQSKSFVNIPKIDCRFGYRTSRFKTDDKGRFFITAITLHLSRKNLQPPFYASLQAYLTDHNISDRSPQTIRKAVIDIRNSKMPNIAEVANNGSFFANPIIDQAKFYNLKAQREDLFYWELEDGNYKLSAAWLMEKAGFKNISDTETGMATWSKQPLVLVNEHADSTANLLKFKNKIVAKVQEMFGITLEQEPELIGEF